MIAALDDLKRVLGIDLDDTSEDDNLTRLLVSAGTWVEAETHRRFDTPIARVEYVDGRNARRLFLAGHIDETVSEDAESAEAPVRLVVSERSRWDIGDWTELTEGEDYERRGDVLLAAFPWGGWLGDMEYRLEYLDGYVTAPADIQDLVIELAMAQYAAEATSAEGTAGVTSETLGDFAYAVSTSTTASSTASSLSDKGRSTLNHYKRVLV